MPARLAIYVCMDGPVYTKDMSDEILKEKASYIDN